jgi:DNA mismatch endonuclease Vsr
MADMFDRETRSRIMKAVRVAETEPEQRLAVALRELGLRFNRNDRSVFGKPDFAFRRRRLAVFVDGDFWHGRAWFERREAPATNPDFWIGKFERNASRDRVVNRELRRLGWSVLRLWGSDVRRAALASARRVRDRLGRLERKSRVTLALKRRRQALDRSQAPCR